MNLPYTCHPPCITANQSGLILIPLIKKTGRILGCQFKKTGLALTLIFCALSASMSLAAPQSIPFENVQIEHEQGSSHSVTFDEQGSSHSGTSERQPEERGVSLSIASYGIAFGNVPYINGLRFNFRDINLNRVNGLNLTVLVPREPSYGTVRGIAIGLPMTGAAHISGLSFALGGLSVNENIQGVQVALLGIGAGSSITGITISGLGFGSGGNVRGLNLAGLG
ncbi:MAG: hypothetical protein ACQETM_09530, partial [Bacteroidota bacterium]